MNKFKKYNSFSKHVSYVNAYNKAPEIGDNVIVHSYKYSGWLYRTWTFPTVVDVNDEYLVLCSTNSVVLTSDENSDRFFPSQINKSTFWFFFKDTWMNLIVSTETRGIKLYVNVASPYIYEEGAIKYYDFDLDFKSKDIGQWIEVDVNEYFYNQIKFNYTNELVNKINSVEKDIKEKTKQGWFDKFADMSLLTSLNKKYKDIIDERNKFYGNSKNKTFRK